MRTRKLFQSFSLLVVMVMLLGLVSPLASTPAKAAPQAQAPEPKSQPKVAEPKDDLTKLHPDLRKVVETETANRLRVGNAPAKPEEPVLVQAVFDITTTLETIKGFFVEGKAGLRPYMGIKNTKQGILTGQILPSKLVKLASRPEVTFVIPIVMEKNGEPDDMPIGDDKPETTAVKPGPEDWARLRSQAADLQAKVKTPGKVIERKDWYEVSLMGPHKAEAAWNRGVTGKGVTVAVNDDGIDYAHPDLIGTQKIIESGPYAGWPMAFSPFSMLAYYLEQTTGAPYISGMYSGTYYADTSTVPSVALCGGPGCRMFDYTPLIDFYTPGYEHTYFFDSSMSKSGVVHVGTHPDRSLRDFVWGEIPAILVTDPNVAGVYDTVYVDLNDNYDFRDDQALTKAVVGDPSTYNNMIAWLDISETPDGMADISGSMVYYVADGVNPIPVSNWLYTDTLGNPLLVPGAGDLVAFSGANYDDSTGYSHGTQCASNVVGQGVSFGFLPDWFKVRSTGDPAVLGGAVQGMAPGAKIVNVGDIYWNFDSSQLDAHLFSAVGYDGCAQAGFDILFGTACTDTDAIQITSNSYGSSAVFNDGWDLGGQFMTQMQRYLAPSLQFTKSTGNGGPGYGTTAPSAPLTGIYVGASTQFGSTGWDSMKYIDQITYNDIIPFSNRGPSARDGTGVDVLATGAFAAGAVKLNGGSIWGLEGNYAWDSWGGTSRSAPTAMGVLALVYDAFKQGNGRWPTAEEAKAIFMATATDLNYNVFSQGAGSVNADRGSLVGLGLYGFYPNVASWTPGNYRGNDWGGFAHVTLPGQSYTKQITLTNPSPYPITTQVIQGTPQKIGSKTFTWDLTQAMYTGKSTSNSLKVPQYILPLYKKADNTGQYLDAGIPAGTDLMIIRMAHPYEKFDRNSNYTWDFRSRMIAYNWEDMNGNGRVWTDKNSNGAVNYSVVSGIPINIDAIYDINWATAEIDQYEYVRYAYSYMTGTHQEIMIQKPVERSTDGIFLGVYVGAQEVAQTYPITFQFEVEFYKYQDLPWLQTLDAAGIAPITEITIPADGTATFTAKVNVPADMPVGDYEASIKLIDPGILPPVAPEGGNPPIVSYPAHTSVIPITVHVAGEFDGTTNLTLGGAASRTYDANMVYNNGAVRGYFDWAWREESGDWRFFYVDHLNGKSIFSENFNGTFPPTGWTTVDHSGSGYTWKRNDAYGSSNLTGGSGYSADADSDAMGGGIDSSLISPPIDLTTATGAILTFKSNFQDFAGSGQGWVKITTDGGLSWTQIFYVTLDEPSAGIVNTIELTPYVGHTIQLEWRFDDENAWAWWWQIDDVTITMPPPFGSNDHIVVVDKWTDTAPYKDDIDTIVLGPTANNGDPYGNFVLPDPAYFGPYKLDVVGSSPDVRSARSIWNFNTSSGSPEDWVMVKQTYQDALYEYLQHNVVFHGNKQSVPFEKTIGTIKTAPDVLNVTAYTDSGPAGVVTIKSSLDFDGLVADAYGLGGPMTYTNVPLAFDGNLWTKQFTVNHAAKIDITTSSSTISDIDLLLYYCGPGPTPGTCSQKASSAGGTSDEHVLVVKPADGIWIMAVDNYSGPAGTFNYTEKIVQGTNLSVTGTVPAGTLIPAGTEKTLNVTYNKAGMEMGKTYEGLLLFGNSKATTLVEVPVYVTRVKSAAKIEKKVDFAMSFPGEQLLYTIDLYNQSGDMATSMSFEDVIPAGTTYVPGSVTGGATYDAGTNSIKWSGVIPVPPVGGSEGFEGGVMPPTGWTKVTTNAGYTWKIGLVGTPHSGAKFADVEYDPALSPQNEWLISPVSSFAPGGAVEFWSQGSVYWCRDDYDNCDLNVFLVVDSPGGGDDILLGKAENSWLASWTYAKSTFNLPATLPAGNLRIGFQYVGVDGAQVALDDIVLPTLGGVPQKTITFRVSINMSAVGGAVITNTASLVAKHDLPSGLQTEPVVTANATTSIGFPANFSTSFKEATAIARPGQLIRYDVHVINSGDAAATIKLTDLIPVGTTYVDHVTDIPYQNFMFMAGPPNWMEWNGTVAPHSEWIFTFRVRVSAAQPRGTNIVNTATIEWVDGTKTVTSKTNIPMDIFMPLIGK